MNSETGLANTANANDDKIFSYSRFSERPIGLSYKKGFSAKNTTSFALKNEKGVICGEEDDNITIIIIPLTMI